MAQVQIGVPGTYSFTAAYPNPFRDQTRFTFAVRKAQQIEIGLYDVLGRQVATVFNGWAEADTPNTLAIDGKTLSVGTYYLRLTSETLPRSNSWLLPDNRATPGPGRARNICTRASQ